MMKKITLILLALVSFSIAQAQGNLDREVRHFNKIAVGDRINLYLIKGDESSVEIDTDGIEPYRIITEVVSGTLNIYLDGARLFDKNEIYRHNTVKAYVTFTDLNKITIKGEGEVVCEDVIQARDFTIVTMGANRIDLEGLVAQRLKTKAYGDNELIIRSGSIGEQKFKLYGENTIDYLAVSGRQSRISIFGESDLKLSSSNRIRYNIFGEGTIRFAGDPRLSKGLMFGERRLFQYVEN
jgi:hypothetical protein